MPDSSAFVSAAGSWVRSQRVSFALVGAVILGQLSRLLFETLRRGEFLTSGKPPLLAVIFLVLALVWCGVIIWARLRVGQELKDWARGWFARFVIADTIPRQYVIEDRGALLAAALCAVLDLVLILVMQNTVREPLLMLTSVYTSPALVDAAFVVVVVLLALFVLSQMYRTSKPVSAYLAWSVMDRLVPTAGFLAGPAPAPALASGRTGSRPSADQNTPRAVATVVDADQTAVSERRRGPEQPSAAPPLAEEATLRAPPVEPEQTTVSERTVVAQKQPEAEQTVVSDKTVVAEKHSDAKGGQQ